MFLRSWAAAIRVTMPCECFCAGKMWGKLAKSVSSPYRNSRKRQPSVAVIQKGLPSSPSNLGIRCWSWPSSAGVTRSISAMRPVYE